MKTKLIQTKDYLLLIDEEAEIKQNSYFLLRGKYINVYKGDKEVRYKTHLTQSIIAYYPLTEEAKELDLPLLPNPFKDEFNNINELAIKHWESRTHEDMDICCDNFIAGYNAAQSKQFSLEDMKKAIEMAREIKDNEGIFDIDSISGLTEVCTYDWEERYSTEEIIQSLSTQQLPKEFIIQLEYWDYIDEVWKDVVNNYSLKGSGRRIKTITNSEGKEVVQGEYKF